MFIPFSRLSGKRRGAKSFLACLCFHQVHPGSTVQNRPTRNIMPFQEYVDAKHLGSCQSPAVLLVVKQHNTWSPFQQRVPDFEQFPPRKTTPSKWQLLGMPCPHRACRQGGPRLSMYYFAGNLRGVRKSEQVTHKHLQVLRERLFSDPARRGPLFGLIFGEASPNKKKFQGFTRISTWIEHGAAEAGEANSSNALRVLSAVGALPLIEPGNKTNLARLHI